MLDLAVAPHADLLCVRARLCSGFAFGLVVVDSALFEDAREDSTDEDVVGDGRSSRNLIFIILNKQRIIVS